jgi:hypothetical protein
MVADNLSVIVMTKQRGTARRTSLALLAPSPTNQPTDRPTDRPRNSQTTHLPPQALENGEQLVRRLLVLLEVRREGLVPAREAELGL